MRDIIYEISNFSINWANPSNNVQSSGKEANPISAAIEEAFENVAEMQQQVTDAIFKLLNEEESAYLSGQVVTETRPTLTSEEKAEISAAISTEPVNKLRDLPAVKKLLTRDQMLMLNQLTDDLNLLDREIDHIAIFDHGDYELTLIDDQDSEQKRLNEACGRIARTIYALINMRLVSVTGG